MDHTRAVVPRAPLCSAAVEATRELGRRLGDAAFPGTLLAVFGQLGAGKTQLAKGVALGLGVTTVVNSPTFVLMNEHSGRLRFFHIDAYRLAEADEAVAAGLVDERQASGVTLVEWADRLEGALPDERLEIALELTAGEPLTRVIRWQAFGQRHAQLAERAFAPSVQRDRADGVAAAS